MRIMGRISTRMAAISDDTPQDVYNPLQFVGEHVLTHQHARTDNFDNIERFYNPLKQRKLVERLHKQSLLTQRFMKLG